MLGGGTREERSLRVVGGWVVGEGPGLVRGQQQDREQLKVTQTQPRIHTGPSPQVFQTDKTESRF